MTRVLETLNALAGYREPCNYTRNTLPPNTWQAVKQSSADWQNKITALRMAGDETNASAAETDLISIIQSTQSQIQAGAQKTMEKLSTVVQPAPAEGGDTGGGAEAEIPIDTPVS